MNSVIHSEIKLLGCDVLKTPCTKVVAFDEELQELIAKMYRVMEEAKGIGLAANQIGINLAVFVTNCRGKNEAFVNPEIIEQSDPVDFENEGCLSVPGVRQNTRRYNRVLVTYACVETPQYSYQEEFIGLPAIVMQHEIDHLSGKLYIDLFNRANRRALTKVSQKFIKESK